MKTCTGGNPQHPFLLCAMCQHLGPLQENFTLKRSYSDVQPKEVRICVSVTEISPLSAHFILTSPLFSFRNVFIYFPECHVYHLSKWTTTQLLKRGACLQSQLCSPSKLQLDFWLHSFRYNEAGCWQTHWYLCP